MSGTLGEPLATGRTALVHPWGDDQVVKVFTPGFPNAAIDREERDAILAHELGLTPIACHGRVDVGDGLRALAFDRVHGVALTTVAERDPRRIRAVARTLAAEHVRVHAVSTTRVDDVRELAASLVDTVPLAGLSSGERAALRAHLAELPAGDTVLHLDFHPLNVFEHDDGHAVIDWQSTCRGAPAADVAMTRLLFTEAELFPGISTFQRILYQSVRRVMFAFYLAEYRRRTGLESADIDRWATAVRVLRLGLLDIESERDALLGRIRAALAEPAR